MRRSPQMCFRTDRVAASIVTLGLLFAPAATAQEAGPKALAVHDDWSALTLEDGSDVLCFAVSEPVKTAPPNVRHGDVYFFVTSWRSGAARTQPSFQAGYRLKPDSMVVARVDGRRFDMFVSGDEAFIEKEADEAALIAAMKRGRGLEIEAFSRRGTATAYEFSLLGVTAAVDRADRACR